MDDSKISLITINEKLDTIIQMFNDNIKIRINKTKQQINKDYYQKLKDTNEEKYEAYLQKMRNRYFKNDKQT